MKRLIIALIIALLVVIYALQNSDTISFKFLFLHFECPESLMLIMVLLIGVLLSLFYYIPELSAKNKSVKMLEQKIKELEAKK
ncbi:MAG: LapA family protein [Bacteroidota bacterium]